MASLKRNVKPKKNITQRNEIMTLTQMQIIQSFGEAMSWFERELGWGVPSY